MTSKFCYRDGNRPCDKSCAAYGLTNVIYGPDANGDIMTGSCIELGLEARLAGGLHRIGEILNELKEYKVSLSQTKEST